MLQKNWGKTDNVEGIKCRFKDKHKKACVLCAKNKSIYVNLLL